MAGLPENVQYKEDFSQGYKPLIAATMQANLQSAKRRPKRKVDTSRYQGVADSVKQASSKLGTVTTPYGGSTKYEKFHPGVDIANKIGTPIPAWSGGRVSEVVSGKKQGDPGYGNYIIVVDDKGNKHRYSHLNDSYVSVGQQVQPGQMLGGMGNTGQSYSVSGGTGSHLDYRILDIYGKFINPYNFIQ